VHDWPEIAELAADPLVTIGAHTVNHPMLAKLSKEAVRSEMDLSRSVIEAALAVRPAHLVLSDRRSAPRPGRANSPSPPSSASRPR
jgi:peptidoglycan/xylan/chitin deacetylase (PgdA/CDA1 family)